jgi:hypothetical protein
MIANQIQNFKQRVKKLEFPEVILIIQSILVAGVFLAWKFL